MGKICEWCEENPGTHTLKMSKKDGVFNLCDKCYKNFNAMVRRKVKEFRKDFIDRTIYVEGEYNCYCPKCDKSMDYKDEYCSKCGTKLEFEKNEYCCKRNYNNNLFIW